ncbi:MAG: hypothetical protein FJ095_10600 [Deltaproteobacteria bacterium]|nr:hypothetical protein [Deltaproteobacteria bacterium]
MKLRPFLGVLGAAVLSSSSALAFDIVTIGAGAQFQAGAVGLMKPDDQTAPSPIGPEDYPGFAGLSLGGGGFVDVRFLHVVGIEFGVLHMTDRGAAEIKISDAVGNTISKFDVKLKQNALHMPLYLKGAIPTGVANIVGFVGPEFVVPLASCKADAADRFTNPDCAAEIVPDAQFPNATGNYGIRTKSSVLVSGGIGFEFKLPIPAVDIRIPFSIRVAGDPKPSEKRIEREFHEGGRVEYQTNWQLQGHANLGVGVYF